MKTSDEICCHAPCRYAAFGMVFLAFMFTSVCSFADDERHVRCVSDALNIFGQFDGETAEGRRVDVAMELASYFSAHRYCGKYPLLVDRLSALLKDRTEGVRIGAAMALENIGPQAIGAIPALEQAIKESDAKIDADTSEYNTVLPTYTSGQAARRALRKITGKPVPDYRESWKKPH